MVLICEESRKTNRSDIDQILKKIIIIIKDRNWYSIDVITNS